MECGELRGYMSSIIKRTVASKLKSVIMYFATLAIVLGGVSYAAPKFFGQVARAIEPIILQVGAGETYTTIQSAIDAASSGDTISVAAGTYAERIIINKSLTINGANVGLSGNATRRTESVIDGGGLGTTVLITGNGVTFDGFQIQNSGIGAGDRGGINIQGVSGSIVKNNIVTNNFIGVGLTGSTTNIVEDNRLTLNYFGVYVGTDTIHSIANTIRNNDISTTKYANLGSISTGDGIYIDKDCSNNTFVGNNIHNNEKNGLYFWKSSSNIINGNTVTYNAASGFEFLGSSDNNITGNTIANNKDGLHIRNSTQIGYSITNNNISSNKIFNNTRVNLYTDANQYTGFKAENNWWGSPDNAVIESKLAGYGFDLLSTTNTTPGTLEYIDFTPYYINVEMTITNDVFGNISNTLELAGIENNLDTVTGLNWSEFTGLTFEKYVNGVKMGSITFNGELDLTDETTLAFLQALGERMNANTPGVISLDFTGLDGLSDLLGGATIKFYGLDKLGFTNLSTAAEVLEKMVVLDDSGKSLPKSILASYGIFTGCNSNTAAGDCWTFTIDVAHFTQFIIDTTAPVITLNGSSSMLLNNGESYIEPGATTNEGTLVRTGSVDTSVAGVYTITYTVTDDAGNVSTAFRTIIVKAADEPVVLATTSGSGQVLDDEVAIADTTKEAETKGEVKGTTDSKKEDASPWYEADYMGLAWYWWIVLVIAAGGLGWWAFGAIRRRNQE